MTSPIGKPRWSGVKAATVAFLAGKGRSTREIARQIGDGTSHQSIASALRRWHLAPQRRERADIPVQLTSHQRAKLVRRASKLGVEPEEFLRRICVCVLDDDLYGAVVDGRFA